MLPPDSPSTLPVTPGRAALFALTRLVTAVALYPWLMGRLTELADRLALPLHHQIKEQGVSCVAAFATLLLVTAGIERVPLTSVGLTYRNALRDLGLGVLGGAAMVSAVVIFLALAGWYHLSAAPVPPPDATVQVRLGVMLLLAAAAEEIVFRGLVFRIIEDAFGTWLGLALSAAYFSWQHGNNPSVSSAGFSGILLFGAFFGMTYVATRSLWMLIGIHWSWNLFEGPIFGAPVSGYHLQSILWPTIDGPELWTGGNFGPEASLPTLALFSLLTVMAFVIARRKGEIRPLRRAQPPTVQPPNDEAEPLP